MSREKIQHKHRVTIWASDEKTNDDVATIRLFEQDLEATLKHINAFVRDTSERHRDKVRYVIVIYSSG